MRANGFLSLHALPEPVRDFVARRCSDAIGLALLGSASAIALSLVTWSVRDPSLNHATGDPVRNLLGRSGAVTADLVMQIVGIASIALLVPVALWGWRLLTRRRLERAALRIVLWLIGVLAACALASLLPTTDRWPLTTGLGGVIGDALLAAPRHYLGTAGPGLLIVGLTCAGVAILALTACAGFGLQDAAEPPLERPRPAPRAATADDEPKEERISVAVLAIGAVMQGLALMRTRLRRRFARRPAQAAPARAPWLAALVDLDEADAQGRVAPLREPTFEPRLYAPVAARALEPVRAILDPVARDRVNAPDLTHVAIGKAAAPLKPAAAIARRQTPPSPGERSYLLPPLPLLSEPKRTDAGHISEDTLVQNAQLLEGVLDDFGVKGEIINVRPGPVVTLYELEPAPGIKSSRVIGLADDIARSMSAISARVAVVQGRNAIGIELPNQRRETVYLRELLASADFEDSKHKLAIALGKTIGGEPVIVDLARMPHLLVAGTTGSGKSVAINTMILSLLYRLKPQECRLIMVDPKMLELSVYDGIPHLLTPVVTDPKKAVVALKWAVREMEDRYKKMSKVGVRNIDGFNARVAEAAERGEVITRTVQTGFDKETGEAVYEQEQMDLASLPYIVVIVDEMADLMMVAGKDIEGAIQRLAQMARAAGIHLIMATQRPSVDVITGTIKANFPTRISFQVTSKIDSRTILGESGGEQLLGQGDMLYMAGGGRISRVHGPFVSDNEVEKIVAHLKMQGQPEYLDAITSEDELGGEPAEAAGAAGAQGMDAEETGDLYDRAVSIVLRDRKCSTSYIQRRLSVGYNKAASLVERMEKEGVVAPANHAGKREILVGGGIDRGAFEPGADE